MRLIRLHTIDIIANGTSVLTVFVLLFFLTIIPTIAQELNCKVTINADQIQTSEQSVFKDMERAIANFLNTRKWTNDTYKNYERIDCGIFLNITKMPSIGVFTASAQITVARPVYNSNYQTVLLNFADRDWEFDYIESGPMEYNDNSNLNNLTSMLAFYAYVILAYDYDSFGELGGNPFVTRALNVVNNSQSSNRAGWTAQGNTRSRYYVVENLNNPQMQEMRKGMYTYHRLALDVFEKDPEQARAKILEVLKSVKKAWSLYPNSIFVISFFDTKATELVKIFSEGSLNVKREAYDLLISLDPKREIYKDIIAK
jgi:Domain of unknown function (DUF4835)